MIKYFRNLFTAIQQLLSMLQQIEENQKRILSHLESVSRTDGKGK